MKTRYRITWLDGNNKAHDSEVLAETPTDACKLIPGGEYIISVAKEREGYWRLEDLSTIDLLR